VKVTSNILNSVHKKKKLNVLTHVVHEGFDWNLCKTGHEFWAIPGEHVRSWDTRKRELPENYHVVNELPNYVDFDVIINGNPLAHYNNLKPISDALNIPIINIWHTMEVPGWNKDVWEQQPFKNDYNVFITPANHITWGPGQLGSENAEIIHHGVDLNRFKPLEKTTKCISIVNDFKNRSREYNLPVWQYIAKDLPVTLVGDNPGLSQPAENFDDLLSKVGSAGIFLGTATISPFSMSYLEAMACGCAMVVAATCSVPDYLDENCALLFNPQRPEDGREYLISLLKDDSLRAKYGKAARKRAEEFSLGNFAKNWNRLLEKY
jgi:glycosyltransferase involved in cell wall biosynthesis